MTTGRTTARAVTLLDVARVAGVSRATASLVLRESPAITAETRARVEAAMAELGYVYNRSAARLRAARSHTIGVLLPNLNNPFFATLVAGIEETVEAAGISVLLANSNEDAARQDRLLTRMCEQGVDGLIVCSAQKTPRAALERLLSRDMPLVQLLRHVEGVSTDFAGTDFTALTFEATERLIALGHRRIAFLSVDLRHSVRDERLAGYAQAMEHHGLEPSLIVEVPLEHGAARSAADAFLRPPAPPTAVLCFNDVVALGLHRGLIERGVRIGVDISLIGIDDGAECDLVVPGLASVATHPGAIGRDAGELLLRRLARRDLPAERRITPFRFADRPSCGRAPIVARATERSGESAAPA